MMITSFIDIMKLFAFRFEYRYIELDWNKLRLPKNAFPDLEN